jgi:hypothetical protein
MKLPGERERPYFLKKRSKKPLPLGGRGVCRRGPRMPNSKSFLVLFFKKEHTFLPSHPHFDQPQ